MINQREKGLDRLGRLIVGVSLLGLGLLLPNLGLASSITVNPLTVVFETLEERYKDVKIFNTGEDVAYVNIELSKVVNPGTDDKQFIQMKADPIAFGLVVTPNKLIIPKGQSRIVRLMRLLKDNPVDGVYQIKIVPVTGDLQAVKDGQDNVIAGVKVVVGYNVSVRILPLHPSVDLTFNRQGTTVTIKNDGNTSVLLSDGSQCHQEQGAEKVCQELPVKRVYAESSWQLKLPTDSGFSYQKTYLNTQEKVEVP